MLWGQAEGPFCIPPARCDALGAFCFAGLSRSKYFQIGNSSTLNLSEFSNSSRRRLASNFTAAHSGRTTLTGTAGQQRGQSKHSGQHLDGKLFVFYGKFFFLFLYIPAKANGLAFNDSFRHLFPYQDDGFIV